MDITPEEFHNSIKSEVAVHSDIKPFTEALSKKLAEKKFALQPSSHGWWQALKQKQTANTEFVKVHNNQYTFIKIGHNKIVSPILIIILLKLTYFYIYILCSYIDYQ